jgi:DNA primase large subunit
MYSEALRRWFISQEVALFRYRISLLQPVEKETMLKFNDLPGVKMTSAEKEQFKPQLSALVYGDRDFDALEFYKVHFTQVLDLVATRKVVLHRGTAFVERDLLVSILITKFRQLLSESLLVAFKARPFINEIEADRLMPFLNTLSERYLASNQEWDGSTAADKILPSQLDFLAARSFPLCMRGLHFQLRSVHHLKYGGRMQYGLFLKGIGLSLEHALEFWRSEFALSQGVDKFDKNYAYNIRHNYGQEGRRVDYTPYSCKKIIMGTAPGHMDYHGCPFRHQDSDKLKQTLQGYGADEKLVAEVVDAARAQHYEIACQKYFDATHPGYVSEVPHSHPNKYFKESMKYFATKEAEKQGAVSSSADKQENKRMSLD